MVGFLVLYADHLDVSALRSKYSDRSKGRKIRIQERIAQDFVLAQEYDAVG